MSIFLKSEPHAELPNYLRRYPKACMAAQPIIFIVVNILKWHDKFRADCCAATESEASVQLMLK
nr:hypothetical protein [uncultured Duganella sp.]